MVFLRGLVLAAVLGSMACHRAPSAACTPAQFGLAESVKGRATIERAITKANAVLGEGSGFVFSPGWQDRPSKTKKLAVYIVDAGAVAATDAAFAPGNAECVFINSDINDRMGQMFGQGAEGTFEIDPTDATALILLHEAGHFRYGDAGDFAPSAPLQLDTLVEDLNNDKSKELRADRYAGELIRAAEADPPPRITTALDLSLCLTHISWNLLHGRLIGNFGATTLSSPKVFRDNGDSHPNLELRFLVLQYSVTRQEIALANVREFLGHRREATEGGGILYGGSGLQTGGTYHLLDDDSKKVNTPPKSEHSKSH